MSDGEARRGQSKDSGQEEPEKGSGIPRESPAGTEAECRGVSYRRVG